MSLLWRNAVLWGKTAAWHPEDSEEHLHPDELEGQLVRRELDSEHVERLEDSIRQHGYDPARHGQLGLNITDHGENIYHHASGSETHPEDPRPHEHLLQALKDSRHGEVPVHVHDQRSDEGGESAPRYYHGTTHEDLEHVHPNYGSSGNFGATTHEPGYAYATGKDSAWNYAERAVDAHGGTPHVYEVNPNGPVEKDPSRDAHGNLRGNNEDDVRSRHGFTVVDEEPSSHEGDEDESDDEHDWG